MKFYRNSVIVCLALLSPMASGWTINAHFDDGEVGTAADRGGDGFSGAGGRSIYSNEVVLKGQSAKLTILEGATGYGSWGGEFVFPERLERGESVWYLVHTYFPEGFDHYSYGEGNRLKFMRLKTHSSAGKLLGYIDLQVDMKGSVNPYKWIYEGEQRWANVGEPGDMIVKDRWESYQMRVTYDSVPVEAGGMAEVLVWKNGRLIEHIKDRITLDEDSGYSDRALLFTYWNGGSPKTQSMYVDEIVITNEKPNGLDDFGNSLIVNSLKNPPGRIDQVNVQ